MNIRHFAPLALLLASFGCAGQAEDVENEDIATDEGALVSVPPGRFKLYPINAPKPGPGCDVHTSLKLERGRAKLEEAIGGFCAIAVSPNPRTFSLTSVKEAGCGSKLYTGTRTVRGRKYKIAITDHRSRMCMDMPFGAVDVTEEIPGRGTVRKSGILATDTTLAVGQACGGDSVAPACGAGLYCRYEIADICGWADAQGKCAAIGEPVCAMYIDPVCGCDGKTYSNRCFAAAAGMSVQKMGACP